MPIVVIVIAIKLIVNHSISLQVLHILNSITDSHPIKLMFFLMRMRI